MSKIRTPVSAGFGLRKTENLLDIDLIFSGFLRPHPLRVFIAPWTPLKRSRRLHEVCGSYFEMRIRKIMKNYILFSAGFIIPPVQTGLGNLYFYATGVSTHNLQLTDPPLIPN